VYTLVTYCANARVNVDTQNIVNQFMLAKINVHGG